MSFMTINQQSPVPLYTQIADQIKAMADEGRLKPGDPLPSIRLTASQLAVAANTVARAYRDLEAAGVVESNGRRGSFIRRDYRPGRNPFDRAVEECIKVGMGVAETRALFESALKERTEENHG